MNGSTWVRWGSWKRMTSTSAYMKKSDLQDLLFAGTRRLHRCAPAHQVKNHVQHQGLSCEDHQVGFPLKGVTMWTPTLRHLSCPAPAWVCRTLQPNSGVKLDQSHTTAPTSPYGFPQAKSQQTKQTNKKNAHWTTETSGCQCLQWHSSAPGFLSNCCMHFSPLLN